MKGSMSAIGTKLYRRRSMSAFGVKRTLIGNGADCIGSEWPKARKRPSDH